MGGGVLELLAHVEGLTRPEVATAKKQNVPNPLAPLVKAWADREPAAYTSRHVQVVQTATGRYAKTPGLLATTSGQLEIVQVDGEPFAGRQPLMPKGARQTAVTLGDNTLGSLRGAKVGVVVSFHFLSSQEGIGLSVS